MYRDNYNQAFVCKVQEAGGTISVNASWEPSQFHSASRSGRLSERGPPLIRPP